MDARALVTCGLIVVAAGFVAQWQLSRLETRGHELEPVEASPREWRGERKSFDEQSILFPIRKRSAESRKTDVSVVTRNRPAKKYEYGDRLAETGGIMVGGLVRCPGWVSRENEIITLGEAIRRAGGRDYFAEPNRLKLLRDGELQTFDPSQSRSLTLLLRNGDTVSVPAKIGLGN